MDVVRGCRPIAEMRLVRLVAVLGRTLARNGKESDAILWNGDSCLVAGFALVSLTLLAEVRHSAVATAAA